MISLKDAINLITIGKKTEFSINIGNISYPSLTFSFEIDSKASIPLEISEISANVYMQSSYMGKVRWTTLDNLFEDDPFKIKEIPALGETWINLRFTPPKDFLKSKMPGMPLNWELRGIFLFKPINEYGGTKTFSIHFKLKKETLDRAIEAFF